MLCLHLHVLLCSLGELRFFELLVELIEACVIALRSSLVSRTVVPAIFPIRGLDVLLGGVVGLGASVLLMVAVHVVVGVRVSHICCAFVPQLLSLRAVLVARIVNYSLVVRIDYSVALRLGEGSGATHESVSLKLRIWACLVVRWVLALLVDYFWVLQIRFTGMR